MSMSLLLYAVGRRYLRTKVSSRLPNFCILRPLFSADRSRRGFDPSRHAHDGSFIVFAPKSSIMGPQCSPGFLRQLWWLQLLPLMICEASIPRTKSLDSVAFLEADDLPPSFNVLVLFLRPDNTATLFESDEKGIADPLHVSSFLVPATHTLSKRGA